MFKFYLTRLDHFGNMSPSSIDDSFMEIDMAESVKNASGRLVCDLDTIERSWVHVSLLAKREQLVRSRNKEVTGSEIWVLRGKEIEALNALAPKFA